MSADLCPVHGVRCNLDDPHDDVTMHGMTDMVYAPHSLVGDWCLRCGKTLVLYPTVPNCPLGTVANIEQWKAKAEAYDKAEQVTMHECCTHLRTGVQMVSPRGDVVGGNGECIEFLLPEGKYRLVPEIGDSE